MPSTLNPADPLYGLRFGNKPLPDLHVREDHRQRVLRARDGHGDPGSTRAAASPADGLPRGHDLACTPSRTAQEATARTTRRGRRAGRAMTALRRALRVIRNVDDEFLRTSQAVIPFGRAPRARPQTPVPLAGQARKAQRRTAAEHADHEDCLICRAIVPFLRPRPLDTPLVRCMEPSSITAASALACPVPDHRHPAAPARSAHPVDRLSLEAIERSGPPPLCPRPVAAMTANESRLY